MANEKIYNKHCFIKRTDGRAYCSVCGKPILQDNYNQNKHAAACGFSKEHDFTDIFRENEDFACGITGTENELIFSVYTPQMVVRPGLSTFSGGTWKCVYRAAFSLSKRQIREWKNGLRNLKFWKEQKMYSLNAESQQKIMERYFHVPFKDFSTFVDIYVGRGFHYQELLEPENASAILEKELEKTDGGEMKWKGYIWGELIYGVDKQKPIFRLDVKMPHSDEIQKMLVAKDYFYTEDKLDVEKMLKERFECMIDEEVIKEFAEAYPQLMLMNYWSYSKKNLLIPLLAEMYDPSLEMLAKSSCTVLADNLYTYKPLKEGKWKKKSNLKKWLGVPAKILKKIESDCMIDEAFLEVICETYQTAREYLELAECINYPLIQFLRKNVLAELKRKRTSITNFKDLSPNVRHRIARYLGERPKENGVYDNRRNWSHYEDYMNMCHQNNRYMFGYTPENLDNAHTVTLNKYQLKLSATLEQQFLSTVSEEEYLKMESEFGEGKEYFKDDDYIIRAPRSTAELIRESAELSHCVRIYCKRVAQKQTKIFFVRMREASYVPYFTIEVCGKTIEQLKGKGNQLAPLEVQQYVRKWAGIKHLYINPRDFC